MRPAGTVGGDDRVLRSSFPAPGAQDAQDAQDDGRAAAAPTPSAAATPPATPPAATTAPRAPDDLDVGWGAAVDDSNDDRLTREKPPHW